MNARLFASHQPVGQSDGDPRPTADTRREDCTHPRFDLITLNNRRNLILCEKVDRALLPLVCSVRLESTTAVDFRI